MSSATLLRPGVVRGAYPERRDDARGRVDRALEWPLGIFVGWHGSVPLTFRPYPGLRQRIEGLNKAPEIEDLYA